MRFVIDMHFPDEIPASYIKEVADSSIIKTVKDQRDFGSDCGIMTTTLYPCGNEVFLNVDFVEAFNRDNVGDSVNRALDSVLSNPVIKRYNVRNFAGWEAAIDDALLSQYHQGYMDLVNLYNAIDKWYTRSKQNRFCEMFCYNGAAMEYNGCPKDIILYSKDDNSGTHISITTDTVKLIIDDTNSEVTIIKEDSVQKSSKTFTVPEAIVYVDHLTPDNIMDHFLVDEDIVDYMGIKTDKGLFHGIEFSDDEIKRIRNAISKSKNPDTKVDEFIKEAVDRYVSVLEYTQFLDENISKQTVVKDVKTVNTNSCDHKCDCECNKKVSSKSNKNTDTDLDVIAGNLMNAVFGEAFKLLNELKNEKENKNHE